MSLNFTTTERLQAGGCIQSVQNDVVRWSISKISSSSKASLSSFTCDEANLMNKMISDQISITTGRRRGEATICLSDQKEYPCKFIIGIINSEFDSTSALSEIYSFTPPKSSQLNETVERLFLKPSSLIQ
tara:strand:+ start:826 stop:1215 length:390 start_codon:yes stop_codon:yes gene_type:complete